MKISRLERHTMLSVLEAALEQLPDDEPDSRSYLVVALLLGREPDGRLDVTAEYGESAPFSEDFTKPIAATMQYQGEAHAEPPTTSRRRQT